MNKSILGCVAILAMLTACQTPKTVKPAGIEITQDQISNIQIAEINVVKRESVADPSIDQLVKDQLDEAIPQCAAGNRALNMNVRIDSFKDSSGAATVVFGDSISLDGLIELHDPTTGALVGEYYGSAFNAGGGLLGLAMLSGAQEQLSKAFARNICDQLFNNPLPEEKLKSPPF